LSDEAAPDTSQYGRNPNTWRRRPAATAGSDVVVWGETHEAPAACPASPPPGASMGAGETESGPAAAGSGAPGAPSAVCAQLLPCGLRAISRPVARPSGRAVGAFPSTGQRSVERGTNGTSTRPPGTRSSRSAACAIDSSYWTDGCGRPTSSIASRSAADTGWGGSAAGAGGTEAGRSLGEATVADAGMIPAASIPASRTAAKERPWSAVWGRVTAILKARISVRVT